MDKFLNELLWSDSESGVRDLSEEAIQRKFQMLQQEINQTVQTSSSSGPSINGPASRANQLEKSKVSSKVKADRDYRIRQKEGKKKLKSDFNKLDEENKSLKKERDDLIREKGDMKKDLESANNEAKKFKREISKLERTIKSQEILLEFSADPQQEDREVKKKMDPLSTKWEDWMKEKEDLLKKVENLEQKNKVSQVQIQVLCSRILKTDSEES